MILLTKLDNQKVLVLIESIKYIEATPDTLVRFVNGDMLIVSESMQEISELVLQFKAQCLTRSTTQAGASFGAASGETASWT
ncbi:MAG: flagellar FlbD family protein [bacterium]